MLREKQIEFPPKQSPVKWLTPVLLLLAVACIVATIIIHPRPPQRRLHRALVEQRS